MNYIKIDKDNLLNGPGIRLVLWLSGCDRKCKECHNPETWDPNIGNVFDKKTKEEIFSEINKNYYSGLTLTGGDPFFKNNREDLLYFLDEFKYKFPDKNIWCWTGHTFESLIPDINNINEGSIEFKILSKIDVLIDGPFKMEQRKIDLTKENSSELLKYRGSTNQRIIDLKKTLKDRRIEYYG